MPFYFDHNATTPVDPAALAAFVESAGEGYGNASSVHSFGQSAKHALETARRRVAALLGATPREIVFTSGGTEADNLAIFGIVHGCAQSRPHVITTAIEHPAVLAACDQLAREGVAITILPPTASGVIDPRHVRDALRPETVLVSVMHANNETGALQPIREIAEETRAAGVLLHSDGVQAAGRIPVNVKELGVDLYSASAHKMNGVKGAGALYMREGVALRAMQFGGHQERGRRAGTENAAAAAAFGVAAEIAPGRFCNGALRDSLERGILRSLPGARLNGAAGARLPNTTSICFSGLSGEAMVIALDLAGFAVSSGAACASGSIEPSHVLLAMGLSEADARASVRFSLGLGNATEQVDALIEAVAAAAPRLRASRQKQKALHYV